MKDVLRVFAVDDEPLALRRIELLLGRIPNINLVGKSDNGPDALLQIDELRPDAA